tara:strand:- start:56329 stop:56577 length:249 start_codon:yes stop_codon:yes gene_type:complete
MSKWFLEGLQFGLGLGTAFFVVVLVMALLSGGKPKDDSDPPNGRSGVAVVTDHRTGLQYLKAPGGGLTPRLGMDGEQIREAE